LDKRQLYEIPVERLANGVADGYDQGTRVLRLPVSICEGSSFRHLGQAVHEASRAFQDMEGSILPWMRDRIGRVARFLLRFVPLLFLVGIFFSTWLIKMVMVLFVGAVLFTVLILCMETKAVQSTLALLREARIFDPDELVVMKRALGVSLLRELASYPLVLMKPFSLR
jgi:Zn-dependent membrane protease YugP